MLALVNCVHCPQPLPGQAHVCSDAKAMDCGGCSGTNMLDEGSIVDELSIILMFLNPFLAKLPDEARQGLCRRMRLEAINRDHTIYKQGEELQNFSLILTGGPAYSSQTVAPSLELRPGLITHLAHVASCMQRSCPSM